MNNEKFLFPTFINVKIKVRFDDSSMIKLDLIEIFIKCCMMLMKVLWNFKYGKWVEERDLDDSLISTFINNEISL